MANGRRYRRQAQGWSTTVKRTPGVELSARTRQLVANLSAASDALRAHLQTLPEAERREAILVVADHAIRLHYGPDAGAEAVVFGELP